MTKIAIGRSRVGGAGRASARGRAARQGAHDVHADGRNVGRRRDAGARERAPRRRPRRSASSLKAQYSPMGSGDDDQPVQGGGRSQAELHRDHGPSGLDRLPRPRQGRGRPGHCRHGWQLAADRSSEGVRPQGYGLCRRRPLCGRGAHRQQHAQGGQAQVRRRGDGLWRVQPGRARQSEKGLADTLEKAGLKVDRLEISQEVNSDPSRSLCRSSPPISKRIRT